jgi:hypothetical protein
LFKVAHFLRNSKKHKLPVGDGILDQRRVEVFEGSDFAQTLSKGVVPRMGSLAPSGDAARDQAALMASLIRARYVLKVTADIKNKKFYTAACPKYVVASSVALEADGVYAWTFDASLTYSTVAYAALMVFGALALVMIKAWPLWLRIAVYWLCLIILSAIIVILLVRVLTHYGFFWVLGFKDIWVLPNFLNDDIPWMDSMVPLVGRGINAERRLREERKESGAGSKEADDDIGVCSSHSLGVVNVVVLFVIGSWICFQLGVFKGENIPDFLATQQEMSDQYGFLLDSQAFEFKEEEGATDSGVVGDEDADDEESETLASARLKAQQSDAEETANL